MARVQTPLLIDVSLLLVPLFDGSTTSGCKRAGGEAAGVRIGLWGTGECNAGRDATNGGCKGGGSGEDGQLPQWEKI